ncbi:HpcH/HpaI aldolase/citrate lyase family protein [Cupriavidus necator]
MTAPEMPASRLRPPELRRSWLFIPGLDSARQQAALESGADVLVADLEEFTAPADRPAAHGAIVGLMGQCRSREVVGAVRINLLENGGRYDLRGVMPGAPVAIFLPHVEQAGQIVELDREISELERMNGLQTGSTEIVPTLESARGLVNAQAILTASQRISACLLAAEDLSASLGVVRGPDAIELRYVRSRFLVDCMAAGCVPIDCPFSYSDRDALEADLEWARRIGMKSRCTVNPGQIPSIHAAFTPSQQQVLYAQDLVRRFEAARAGASGGEPVDPPDYHTAKRLLARHARLVGWKM